MNKDTIRITNNIIKTYAFKISYTPDKNRITKHNIKTLSELLATKKREYPWLKSTPSVNTYSIFVELSFLLMFEVNVPYFHIGIHTTTQHIIWTIFCCLNRQILSILFILSIPQQQCSLTIILFIPSRLKFILCWLLHHWLFYTPKRTSYSICNTSVIIRRIIWASIVF